MARPASSYRAGWRNLVRPMGGMSPTEPRRIKEAARQVAGFARRNAKVAAKPSAAR